MQIYAWVRRQDRKVPEEELIVRAMSMCGVTRRLAREYVEVVALRTGDLGEIRDE